MSLFQRLIHIPGGTFDESGFIGLGTQCAALCQRVETLVPGCTWFVADFDPTSWPYEDWPQWETKIPRYVGTTSDLVQFITPVPQLIWGVFLAVPPANMPPTWTREYWTEDDPPETLDGAMFELRAFDTSYFECYAVDDGLLDQLAQAYGVEVIRWDDIYGSKHS